MAVDSQFKRLRAVYDAAFQQWAPQAYHWQSLARDPNQESQVVEEAHRRVEEAQNHYRIARNLLADFMIRRRAEKQGSRSLPGAAGGRTPDPQPAGTNERTAIPRLHVERVAHRIWEDAGRPNGSAEADWRRAEEILSRP